MREWPCEMGEKFRRWVRNFGDEASERREQMEKEREKKTVGKPRKTKVSIRKK